MGPKASNVPSEHNLFRMEMVNLLDQRHELIKLAGLIDWQAFANEWGPDVRVHDGPPGAAHEADGRAPLPQANARAVGRGGGASLGGEPVLAALQRRAVLPARAALRSFHPGALAPKDRRGGLRMAAGAQHQNGAGCRGAQASEPEHGSGGHDGAAQGDSAPHRQPTPEPAVNCEFALLSEFSQQERFIPSQKLGDGVRVLGAVHCWAIVRGLATTSARQSQNCGASRS